MANPVGLQKCKNGMTGRLPHMRWESKLIHLNSSLEHRLTEGLEIHYWLVSLPISYSHITVVQKSELTMLLLVQTWFEEESISDKKIIGETE